MGISITKGSSKASHQTEMGTWDCEFFKKSEKIDLTYEVLKKFGSIYVAKSKKNRIFLLI